MLLCGAFATIIPLFVAVSTSTLSTPIPARPTIFKFLALFKSSASTWVPLRTIKASYSLMRSKSSSRDQSTPIATVNSFSSSSMPAGAIF